MNRYGFGDLQKMQVETSFSSKSV